MEIAREFLFEEGAHFKSCHASTVLPMEDGTVLAAYFAGAHEKADDVGIWLSRRVDGNWEAPVCVAKMDDTAHWNPVLMPIPGGARLIFKKGKEIHEWQSITCVSCDNGKTWSEAVPCKGVDAQAGPVRCKPLYLKDGSMLAPCSIETETEWRPRIDISFDNGASFPMTAWIPIETAPEGSEASENVITGKGAIQPSLWESAPGHIHAFLRTTCGRIYRSDSEDCGRTWCKAYDTGLPNNNAGIDVAQIVGKLYLVSNPVGVNWGDRTPLTIQVSEDNGRTFRSFCVLEDQKDDPMADKSQRPDENTAEFSYPAMVEKDGELHITYTYLRRRICYRKIRP